MMSFAVVSIIIFSVAVALLIANLFGIPQSTSQATVMAVTAPAIYFHAFNSEMLLLEIVPTWFILPIIVFGFSLLLIYFADRLGLL